MPSIENDTQPVTPQLLTRLELELREYYDPRLTDFTQIAFKLCEGMYQVELVRCLRQSLLDLVVIGYQQPEEDAVSGEQALEVFALHLPYPMIIVGPDNPNQLVLNPAAQGWLDELELPVGSWRLIDPVIPAL